MIVSVSSKDALFWNEFMGKKRCEGMRNKRVWVFGVIAWCLLVFSASRLCFRPNMCQEMRFTTLFSYHPGCSGREIDLLGVDRNLRIGRDFFKQLRLICTARCAAGKNWLAVVPFDAKVGVTVRTLICSLLSHGLSASDVLLVCLDWAAYSLATKWNLTACPVGKNVTLSPFEKHKLKLVLPYFLVMNGLSSYLIDSDVVFFGDFWALWQSSFDLEMASNIPDVIDSESFSFRKGELNTGQVKNQGIDRVALFLRDVIVYSMVRPKWKDQRSLNAFLKKSKRRPWGWFLPGYNLSLRVLEPVLAPTGSVVFCRGRHRLRELARRRNISSPVAVHVNWHVYVEAKIRTFRVLGWLVNESCNCPDWPFWTTSSLPTDIKCQGVFVVQYDGNITAPLSYFHVDHW